jgi:hypothetical protein
MLNPTLIVKAVTALLQDIPALATAMTGIGPDGLEVRIWAHRFLPGQDLNLTEAIYKMPSPSILVAWEGTQGGNFSGYAMWKHRVCVYLRAGNAAGVESPLGYEDLWALVCNGIPATLSTVNLRYTNLLPDLDIPDTPSIARLQDTEQMDIFRAEFIFPEIGDN